MFHKFDTPKEHTAENIEEVFEILHKEYTSSNRSLGFRGHANSEWILEPSLARFMKEKKRTICHDHRRDIKSFYVNLGNRLISEFKENLIVNGDLSEQSLEKVDLWQYGQHFGLPTPLLDWTYSPFVALFFSLCEPGGDDTKRCIWVLDLVTLQQINGFIETAVIPKLIDTIKPESSLREYIDVMNIIGNPSEHNKRLSFQQGFFTKQIYYSSFQAWLKIVMANFTQNKCDRPLFQKVIFSCNENERLNALETLGQMNINFRTLFPDINGSVLAAKESAISSFRKPRISSIQFSI